jgi:LysM repeat protein
MRLVRVLVITAIVSLSLASVANPALADGGVTYVVRPGDTLATIAAANGSTTHALIDANGLSNPDLLRVGQQLIIPHGTAAPPTSIRTAPQSASSPTGPVRPATYIVKSGQTLSQIARELGVSLAAIVDANGLANPDRIYTGMALRVPGAQSETTVIGPVTDTRLIASISEQRCWLYQAGKLTGNWRCSSGRKASPTVPGSYRIQSKINPAYASRWDFWMPYWMGLYYAGSTENGIHGLPYNPKTGRRTWEGLVGTPITYGCIMLDDANVKTLFNVAYIGMSVVILP